MAIKNLQKTAFTGTAVLVAYDENGRLIAMNMQPASLASGARTTMTLSGITGAVTLKAFMLDEGLQPYGNEGVWE